MSNAGLPHTPHIFISHNSADNDLGYQLVRDLRAMYGEDAVWYDSRGGILPGDPWPERLQLELTSHDTFLVLLSPESVASPWVRDEINMAWQQHNSPRGKVIIPALLHPCDIPPYLATIQYVSFLPDDPNHPYELALAELANAIRLAKTRIRDIPRMPLIPQGPPHDTLPTPDHFVGRVADLTWVMDRLRQGGATAITALNGLGGIGKTALASEAARRLRDDEHRFRHGTVVVDCRDVYDAATILRTVLGRFPLDGSLDEAGLPTLANLIRQHLRDKDILVLLDNIEPASPGWRVQDATRPLRESGATLLLTSRQPIPGDAVPLDARYTLHLMQQDDALDLFAESYGLPNAAALSAEDHAAATSIIATIERHTLAVKLAGAYARDLTRPLAIFAAELASDPLKIPADDETPRAVALLFARSVDQLPLPAQRVFAALAAFATPEFGRRAALAVAPAVVPTDTALQPHTLPQPQSTIPTNILTPEDALDLLIRRALLDAIPAEMPPPAQPGDADAEVDRERLRLHALVRHYAATRLALHTHHQANLSIAEWYAAYANATEDSDLALDEQNIVGALEWVHSAGPDIIEDADRDELIADLCVGMGQFWRDRGKTSASLRYLPWGVAAAERALGDRLSHDGDTDTDATSDQSGDANPADTREAWRRRASRLFWLLYNDGYAFQITGELDIAHLRYSRCLTLAQEAHNRRGEGVSLGQLGQLAQQRGQLDAADRYYQQSLAIHREVSDRQGEGVDLTNLGQLARQRGDYTHAQHLYVQALELLRQTEDAINSATCAHVLGELLLAHGGDAQRAEGCALLAEALRLYQQIGIPGADGVRATAAEFGCDIEP